MVRSENVQIAVDDRHIAGTLITAAAAGPGVLFVHGWGDSQARDRSHAQDIAALGGVCLTFDLRGHSRTEALHQTVTREQNLRDVIAAYDLLAGHPAVDGSGIAIVGSSYGGYLAAIVSALRPVRWIALRVPALYRDRNWLVPKYRLDRRDIAAYRSSAVSPDGNRALAACADFQGDVLIVESEHDHLIPHPVIASYIAAFRQARSVTHHLIEGADHALSGKAARRTYASLLIDWIADTALAAE